MTDSRYQMSSDGGPDDLPRTFRREREARERELREREAREREQRDREAAAYAAAHPAAAAQAAAHAAAHPGATLDPMMGVEPAYAPANAAGATLPASVQRIDMPFMALVTFFLKAVLAAIPALLLLGVILWGFGHLLQAFFPSLVKMQILVWFPN